MAYCTHCSKTVVGSACSSSLQARACIKRRELTSRGSNGNDEFSKSIFNSSGCDSYESSRTCSDSSDSGSDGGCGGGD